MKIYLKEPTVRLMDVVGSDLAQGVRETQNATRIPFIRAACGPDASLLPLLPLQHGSNCLRQPGFSAFGAAELSASALLGWTAARTRSAALVVSDPVEKRACNRPLF